MKVNIKIIGIIILTGLYTFVYSAPKFEPGLGVHPITPTRTAVIQQTTLDGNNIRDYIINTGIMDIDLTLFNTPGFEWPINTNQDPIFTSGLTTAAYVGGTLLMASAMYAGEYSPGYVAIVNGAPKYQTDSRFRIYKVNATDYALNPKPVDWQHWGDMVPFGAPYIDISHSGTFNPNIDIAGIKDASETEFQCLTDADPSTHHPAEGFGGGTAPMYAELHLIYWCYNTPGLEDMNFVQYTIYNKNILPWTKVYTAITTDPDCGCPNDDYIGCDTTRNLGYVYNGEDNDCNYTYRYAPPVPAAGQDYFTSPVVYTGNYTDTVVYYIPPGSDNRVVRHGWKQLRITAFGFFTNPGTPGPVCERDPNPGPLLAYHYMQGTKSDASPWMIPPGGDAQHVTKFVYTGDPESNQGWCEANGNPNGAVWNCGGSYTGELHQPNIFGDRRYLICSGADNFTINPADSEIIVLAQLVARGSTRLNSVTQLKKATDIAQRIYSSNFHVIPPPPQPIVHLSASELSNRGTYGLTLSWTDTSEFYNFRDSLFGLGGDDTLADSLKSYYKFQGYEVWEMDPSPAVQSPPDFSKMDADYSSMKLLAIFDKVDTIGQIVDSFPTGNGTWGVFPVVPQYKFPIPLGFPQYGITRSITVTATQFPASNNNATELIYGHNYRFLVTAYANNTRPLHPGQHMIRNSLSASIIPVHIEAPLAGTQFYFRNGDTLNTNRRDLGVIPIVKAQELLIDASYRIVFNKPDTTYNIYRSTNHWGTPGQLIWANQKFTYNFNGGLADDSSRIVDGIDFKVYKIKGDEIQPPGTDTGNIGVVRDPLFISGKVPVDHQTRYPGWEYKPPQNQFLTGSKYTFQKPFNSVSMALTYPNKTTWVGLKSRCNPEDLRNVQIVFTGYGNGNGQQAYRYLAAYDSNTQLVNFFYQNMAQVPLRVYEVDPSDSSSNSRQLNCAFLEFDASLGGNPDGKWDPNAADSTGGRKILYIFNSNYNQNADPFYTTKDLLLMQPQIDVMYVWAPKLNSPGATFHNGDQLIIYPYMTTRPEITPGYPLYYQIESKKPIIGDRGLAATNNDLNKITIVPNPYYGYSALETPSSGHFVTIRRLPVSCTVKIYTLNGDLIRTLTKNDASTSELKWDMKTLSNVPVASGIYIILVDAPGIGQKVLKAAIFTVEERIDF